MGSFVRQYAEPRVKTYRRHGCTRQHRTFRTLAKCMWPRACWVVGEGEWALLAHCRVLSVSLWPDLQAAEKSKRIIDLSFCGGMCSGRHEIVRLSLVAAS